MSKVVEKFLKYVEINTTANPDSESCPSFAGELDLAKLLKDELTELGLTNVSLDNNGYVMAVLPANTSKKMPIIGLIAHMDTSPDLSGENVKPQLISNYDGGDIVLNKAKSIVLSPKDFPEMKNYTGQTLITTDGTTLLGADNKAGIAEIMEVLEYLKNHPKVEHGTIKIGFTPDEEVGRGADKFDVNKFSADFAYTIDGGELGELEYENFNASGAVVNVKGRNVHPGSAKHKMINASQIAMEFHNLLPVFDRPEHTEHYEGFYHLTDMSGCVDEAKLKYIVRDHCKAKFAAKKELLNSIAILLNQKYGSETVTVLQKDQYFNMKEKIEPFMHIIELAKRAYLKSGVEPKITPVRGGTDGARLSYMGLPTPNIFTGGHNYHGRYEYIPVESMEKAVQVIINLVTMDNCEIEVNTF